MFGKIKLRKSDILYSKYLRKLRKYVCERCYKFYPDGIGLQVSHFYGRAKECVRFDEENTDCLCAGCHQYFTANPNEYVEWKKKQLGEKKFKLLTLRAHIPGKRDDKLMEICYKIKLKNQ